MMKLVLILPSIALNVAAQLFIRKGMLAVGEIDVLQLTENVLKMLLNLWLWAAMICYVASFLLWMVVLSKVEVSYAYPFLSVGYVFAALAGYLWFNESLSAVRMLGIFVICLGVCLISRS